MNTKIKWGILAIPALALFSCGLHEDLYDPEKAIDSQKTPYETAFEEKYGEIAPDQDWGFGEKVTTKAAHPNSNQWSDFTIVPEAIPATEKEKVTKWFETHQNPTSLTVSWTDFFVQQVSGSHANMDYLVAVDENNQDDHINNFNAHDGAIMLMQNSGTASFGYFNSMDSQMHYKYTIQNIGGSYYVGFDFEATGQNPNQQEAADGYYNDWIVKITPARYIEAKRIFAEDRGTIGDFDFNDVVFDVYITEEWWPEHEYNVVITLLAAGGTLPLYIGDENDENEVHHRFGVGIKTMVNTAEGDHQEMPPVIFRLKGYASIADIPIIVGGKPLKAEVGKAPEKICIPATPDWANERQSIEKRYPLFKDYVSNPQIEWWKE